MDHFRHFLSVLLVAGAASAPLAAGPNVILIMADDMGFSDIGCYGGEVRTPHLDRLAAQGLRFTQFYNNAKCTTTRASVVTGLYPRRGKGGLLRPDMVTIGEALQKAGYRTALSGKWHLGHDEKTHPFRRGFETVYGLMDGCSNFFDPARPDPAYKGGQVRYFTDNDRRVTEFPPGYYTTDAFTDHALRSMDQFAQAGQPFFLHVCYTAPHYPLHAREEDIAPYIGRYRMGWDVLRRQRYQKQLELGLFDPAVAPLSDGDSRAYSWDKSDHTFEDRRMAVYAAMITCMDRNIGRLMARLEELKIADNTVVMFLSDNGGCAEEPGGRNPQQRNAGPADDYVAVGPSWGWAQNAPFRRYKSWTHEGGISTPFIVHWPGHVPAGSFTQEVGHIIDLMPTALDLAGAPALPLEGRSLKSVFLGNPPPQTSRKLFWEWAGNRAIRDGHMKAVWDSGVKQWELYDLKTDRTETRNLAAEQPKLAQTLAEEWTEWARRCELNPK